MPVDDLPAAQQTDPRLTTVRQPVDAMGTRMVTEILAQIAGVGMSADAADLVAPTLDGTAAAMRFRRRRAGGFDRASARLAPRSAYHLTGEARHKWEHRIAPMPAPRWSITFRSLSEKGRLHRATDQLGSTVKPCRP